MPQILENRYYPAYVQDSHMQRRGSSDDSDGAEIPCDYFSEVRNKNNQKFCSFLKLIKMIIMNLLVQLKSLLLSHIRLVRFLPSKVIFHLLVLSFFYLLGLLVFVFVFLFCFLFLFCSPSPVFSLFESFFIQNQIFPTSPANKLKKKILCLRLCLNEFFLKSYKEHIS